MSSRSNQEILLSDFETGINQFKQSIPGSSDCFLILSNGVKVKGNQTSHKFKAILDSKGTLAESLKCPPLLSDVTVYMLLLDKINEVKAVLLLSEKGVQLLDMSGFPGGYCMI